MEPVADVSLSNNRLVKNILIENIFNYNDKFVDIQLHFPASDVAEDPDERTSPVCSGG